jgi:hypothetical protein
MHLIVLAVHLDQLHLEVGADVHMKRPQPLNTN